MAKSKSQVTEERLQELLKENPSAKIYRPLLAEPFVATPEEMEYRFVGMLEYIEDLKQFTMTDFQKLYYGQWVIDSD